MTCAGFDQCQRLCSTGIKDTESLRPGPSSSSGPLLGRPLVLLLAPGEDSGYPVGYWALISDPDGHTLEIAYGQEVALTVEESSNEEEAPPR